MSAFLFMFFWGCVRMCVGDGAGGYEKRREEALRQSGQQRERAGLRMDSEDPDERPRSLGSLPGPPSGTACPLAPSAPRINNLRPKVRIAVAPTHAQVNR